MRTRWSVVAIALVIAATARAQTGRTPAAAGELQFALTYNASHSGVTTAGAGGFWLQGGSAQLSGTFYRGLGAVAKVTGLHAGNTGEGLPLNLVTATFGPRYTWVHQSGRHSLALFGQGLAGEVNGFRSYFPHPGGAIQSANSLAVEVGGGADLGLNRYVGLRLIEANWLRLQLPNAATNVQNNLLLGTGIVFKLGR